jgi:hypothetical protein
MKLRHLLFPGAVSALLAFSALPAGAAGILITNTSFTGETVYGATNYVQLGNANPTYIANNLTGDNDILSSPGGGYQTANPVVANNVADSGSSNVPYVFGWTGGIAPLSGAAFGAGITGANAGGVGFALSDTSVGCCTASYMITSTESDYLVGGAGYNGTFGSYLSISGVNLTGSDAAVASAIVSYSINGGAFVAMPQLVLAAGGNCNNVAIGGAGGNVAAIAESGCNGNTFTGLAIDNLGAVNWAAGTTVDIVATLTAYADPMATDNFFSIQPDGDLLSQLGASLPGFDGDANTGQLAPTPEPATFGICGGVVLALGLLSRRRSKA